MGGPNVSRVFFVNLKFVVSLIIKTYASLGSGSAEMHGSATTVGESADVR